MDENMNHTDDADVAEEEEGEEEVAEPQEIIEEIEEELQHYQNSNNNNNPTTLNNTRSRNNSRNNSRSNSQYEPPSNTGSPHKYALPDIENGLSNSRHPTGRHPTSRHTTPRNQNPSSTTSNHATTPPTTANSVSHEALETVHKSTLMPVVDQGSSDDGFHPHQLLELQSLESLETLSEGDFIYFMGCLIT